MKNFCLTLLMIFAWSKASYALDRELQRGKTLLETMCTQCHAVGATGQSPHIGAPPFADFPI